MNYEPELRMKNIMQTLPVVLIALFSSSCPAYDEAVSLETLMNGLQECLRQISTMSADVEVRELAEWHPNHGEMEKTQNVSKFVLHRDEQRVEWIGQSSTLNAEGLPIEAAGFQIREICDGQRYIRLHQFESSKGALTALIKTDYREDVERSLDHPRFCSPLYGRIYGNSHLDLHALLASGTTELHQGQEEIKGYNCYVVAAQTPHGLVTAWIAPEVGFNAVKWSIVKSSANFLTIRSCRRLSVRHGMPRSSLMTSKHWMTDMLLRAAHLRKRPFIPMDFQRSGGCPSYSWRLIGHSCP